MIDWVNRSLWKQDVNIIANIIRRLLSVNSRWNSWHIIENFSNGDSFFSLWFIWSTCIHESNCRLINRRKADSSYANWFQTVDFIRTRWRTFRWIRRHDHHRDVMTSSEAFAPSFQLENYTRKTDATDIYTHSILTALNYSFWVVLRCR